MTATRVSINKNAWPRFLGMLKLLAKSEAGPQAKLFAFLLLCFLLSISALNVINSYVGRDFMTAIESKQMGGFVKYALIYLVVFTISTAVAVFLRYCEERLGLLWRHWLTARAIDKYTDDHTYFTMNAYGDLKNPDQRIAEDIRSLTATTLSFVLMLLNATITVIAFAGVMWSISPLLLLVTVLYAAAGSLFSFYLGRPLIHLNYDQSDKEANFRARLVHVRENAESIALVRQEDRLRDRLQNRLEQLVANYRRIIDVNRNLGFFTTGYNYLIQIIPALLVAPLFIGGHADFGVISQSAMAFGHLIGAFSLIVTQFQSISAYTAVIARLGALADAMDAAAAPTSPAIAYCNDCGLIAFDRLTLRSPRSGRYLVKDLTVSLPLHSHVLIRVADDSARTALFRATAGLWNQGEGEITRPESDDLLFLPERPYVPPGTLREVLLPGAADHDVVFKSVQKAKTNGGRRFSDEGILNCLRQLRLVAVIERAGGLDSEKNWSELLSLGEQQTLAFARVLLAEPAFVFLDHPSRALSEAQLDELLLLLRERDITYVTLGEDDDDTALYDQLLTIHSDGHWTLVPLRGAAAKPLDAVATSG
ncbi:ABC transporter transmembrane domain-containing protein [uncultured Thiodictyon sp.]|uniref:ABC transporter ATP-binding protein/permease n=1 Tax=uncultured Thiodictyon sp. TaxID=1846217 RepID=UPI0025D038F7|nr:ABC transporter transmembrane domain-containing protein [uncultured Thiodictyon sp.]